MCFSSHFFTLKAVSGRSAATGTNFSACVHYLTAFFWELTHYLTAAYLTYAHVPVVVVIAHGSESSVEKYFFNTEVSYQPVRLAGG
jgi:hypothetical protein